MSSRATCGLYVAKFRVSPPSKCCRGVFQFASIGKWQPEQLVVHDVWHVMHIIWLLGCASLPDANTPGPHACDHPSSISFARAARGL
jgi:hypothetical protein